MNLNLVSYAIYLTITFYITVVVGYRFYKNGIHVVMELFHPNTEGAHAINRLLLVGYYLVNLGYLAISIRTWPTISSIQIMTGLLFKEVSFIFLVLALLHYNNLFWLHYLSKRKHVIKFLTH
ncbi:MAG: hypothetical protein ACI8SE_000306 [Bacteroidia bacterium]|jgi:hypothetical protein